MFIVDLFLVYIINFKMQVSGTLYSLLKIYKIQGTVHKYVFLQKMTWGG